MTPEEFKEIIHSKSDSKNIESELFTRERPCMYCGYPMDIPEGMFEGGHALDCPNSPNNMEKSDEEKKAKERVYLDEGEQLEDFRKRFLK